jgi:SAM-dependent methyltransferase
MTDVPYTHGHHESVLRSHRWRTAANSAGYLLPHLRSGLAVLDVGCGPGNITADLADRVAPGAVVGVDAAEAIVAAAAAEWGTAARPGLRFEVGDVYRLGYEDGTFDVVHAHQVLQHLADPVAALVEMRRVCRSGGLVAVRDADYPAMTYFPPNPRLDRSQALYVALSGVLGTHCDAGRRLLSWARSAGFSEVTPSASVWCFATPEERAWWGGLWADRVTSSDLADQLVDGRLATPGDLEAGAEGWREWAAAPDGWFAVLHGEVLCRP